MTDLPDRFVVRERSISKVYENEYYREGGRWLGIATVSCRLPFSTRSQTYPARPAEEDHVRHMYEEYEVIDE